MKQSNVSYLFFMCGLVPKWTSAFQNYVGFDAGTRGIKGHVTLCWILSSQISSDSLFFPWQTWKSLCLRLARGMLQTGVLENLFSDLEYVSGTKP